MLLPRCAVSFVAAATVVTLSPTRSLTVSAQSQAQSPRPSAAPSVSATQSAAQSAALSAAQVPLPSAGGGPAVVAAAVVSPVPTGEVTLLVVDAEAPLASVTGTAFERQIRFWPAGDDGRRWQGFVGVPIGTRAGTHAVDVRVSDTEGRTSATEVSVVVEARRYATRRLTVEERFANPPAGQAERIARDARRLASAFATYRPERLWSGPFELPVPGQSTSSFGRLTVLNGQPGTRHAGADFRATTGTPVRAPNAGQIVLAEDLYFSGNTVIVDHGAGLFSLFAHFSKMHVAVGDTVARGDVLGEAGATGRVTGPHVHWAVRLESLAVDPLSLVRVVTEAGLAD